MIVDQAANQHTVTMTFLWCKFGFGKCFGLLISSAVILETKKIKSFTVSIVSSSICHKMMGLNAMHDTSFLRVEF